MTQKLIMASAVIRLSVQSESKALCMFMSCQGFVYVCVCPCVGFKTVWNAFSFVFRGENVEDAFLDTAKKIYQNIQDGRWVRWIKLSQL